MFYKLFRFRYYDEKNMCVLGSGIMMRKDMCVSDVLREFIKLGYLLDFGLYYM